MIHIPFEALKGKTIKELIGATYNNEEEAKMERVRKGLAKVWYYTFRLDGGVQAASRWGATMNAAEVILTKQIPSLTLDDIRRAVDVKETDIPVEKMEKRFAEMPSEVALPKTIQQLLQEQEVVEQVQKARPKEQEIAKEGKI